jgi:hypothetical protein
MIHAAWAKPMRAIPSSVVTLAQDFQAQPAVMEVFGCGEIGCQ